MNQDVRWKQRFENYKNAFRFLQGATERKTLDDPLQAAGLIQSFEFTLELAWKTLKDYLEEKGLLVKYPREVLKAAFQNDLIKNGHIWLEMLDKRNELSHTYDEAHREKAVGLICQKYFPCFKEMYDTLCQIS